MKLNGKSSCIEKREKRKRGLRGKEGTTGIDHSSAVNVKKVHLAICKI